MTRLKLPYQAFQSVYVCRQFEVFINTHFLTMAEVAKAEDSEVIIDCVAISYEEGEGGDHYRKKNKFRFQVSRIEKCLVKLKERIW